MIEVRDICVGDGTPKICVSVTGENRENIINEAEGIMLKKPDIVEWRFDCSREYDYSIVEDILMNLRAVLRETPLIFTFRTMKEGGMRNISSEAYRMLYETVASTGLVDFIDVEGISNGEIAPAIIKSIKDNGVKVITSYHDFDKTPSKDELREILNILESKGGDIVKIAVMPQNFEDVINLIEVTKEYKNTGKSIISMSMGELGIVSRVCGKNDGSCVTFASVIKASAPGQIPIKTMREYFKQLDNFDQSKNIFLIGFMGTGKTTISNILGVLTGMEVYDLDEEIVKKAGMSINEIFEKFGEDHFRDIESEVVEEFSNKDGVIISCGGGAVLRSKNVDCMKEKGNIFLLRATPETVYERVKDSTDRPILNEDMSIDHISMLMNKRRDIYEACANVKIDTDDLSAFAVAMKIIEKNS